MAKKTEQVVPEIIDSVEGLNAKMAAMREAQKVFATYTQEQVDKIFFAAASAANKMRIPLAKMAVEETGMGVVEDKVIKNNYAAEYIYNAYKNTKTVGVVEEDKEYGIKKIAEPIGLIAAVIPTTNPTSTPIFKTLISLKTRNAIIISPHPRAKKSTIEAAKVVLEAAVKAGAPEGIIGWIDVPSLELTNEVMRDADIILATGGPGMVKAAYSSGKPALGVGAGNTPVIIDDTADIRMAVKVCFRHILFPEQGYLIILCNDLFSIRIIDSDILTPAIASVAYCKMRSRLFSDQNRIFICNIIFLRNRISCGIGSDRKLTDRKCLMIVQNVIENIFFIFFF